MPRQAQAKTLRRLQNEMQMLLYHHPLNDERARFKLANVNSFWVSGTGTPEAASAADASVAHHPPTLHTDLRASALHDDGHAWALAWHALDQSLLAQAVQQQASGEAVNLMLAGERQAVALSQRPKTLWARLQRRFSAPSATALLSSL